MARQGFPTIQAGPTAQLTEEQDWHGTKESEKTN